MTEETEHPIRWRVTWKQYLVPKYFFFRSEEEARKFANFLALSSDPHFTTISVREVSEYDLFEDFGRLKEANDDDDDDFEDDDDDDEEEEE